MISIESAEQIAAAIELPDWVLSYSSSTAYRFFGPALDAFQDSVRLHYPQAYTFVERWTRVHRHPFADRLPFLNPWHGVACIVGYLALILVFRTVGSLGAKCSCRSLGIVHNLGLHLLSVYMCFGLIVSARAAGYSFWNNAAGTSPAEWRIAKLIWLFYVSKVIEWMDTVIMLLKKNYRQVSFLHVYHHSTIFMLWWLASLAGPGGEAYYSAMVNSGVHIVMYGYYFLTLLFPQGKVRNILNNFKFIITKGQMVQFTLNCMQSAYDLVWLPRADLKYSANLMQVLFWYMVTLLALFGNFLRKNEKKSRQLHNSSSAKCSKTTDAAGMINNGMKFGVTKAQLDQLENGHGKHGKVSQDKVYSGNRSHKGKSGATPAKPLSQTPIFSR